MKKANSKKAKSNDKKPNGKETGTKKLNLYTAIAVVVVLAAGGFLLLADFGAGPATDQPRGWEGNVTIIISRPTLDTNSTLGLNDLGIPLTFTNLGNETVSLPDIEITLFDPKDGSKYLLDTDYSTPGFRELLPHESRDIAIFFYIPPGNKSAVLRVESIGVREDILLYRDGEVMLTEPLLIEL